MGGGGLEFTAEQLKQLADGYDPAAPGSSPFIVPPPVFTVQHTDEGTPQVTIGPSVRYSAGLEFGRAYRHAPAVTLREMRELPFVSCPLPDCHLRVTLSATPAVVEQACRECGHAGRVGAALRDWSRQYDHLQDAHARWPEGTELGLLHALGTKLVELLSPVYPGPAKLLVDGYGHCLVWEWTP